MATYLNWISEIARIPDFRRNLRDQAYEQGVREEHQRYLVAHGSGVLWSYFGGMNIDEEIRDAITEEALRRQNDAVHIHASGEDEGPDV